MPLPSDITSDPDPSVGEDEDGNMVVLTSDGLAATFKDGRWQPGSLFNSLRWMNEFFDVTDQQEKDLILNAAANALRECKLLHSERSKKTSEQSTSDDSPLPKNYDITVFDNFHRGECWLGWQCPTAEEAIASVKETVDRDLQRFWSELWEHPRIRPATLGRLISQYKTFAETPVAFDDKGEKIFDTIAYMEARAAEVVGDAPSGPVPLPSDITTASVLIGEDEFGNMVVVTAGGLATTLKDGKWQPGGVLSKHWKNTSGRCERSKQKEYQEKKTTACMEAGAVKIVGVWPAWRSINVFWKTIAVGLCLVVVSLYAWQYVVDPRAQDGSLTKVLGQISRSIFGEH